MGNSSKPLGKRGVSRSLPQSNLLVAHASFSSLGRLAAVQFHRPGQAPVCEFQRERRQVTLKQETNHCGRTRRPHGGGARVRRLDGPRLGPADGSTDRSRQLVRGAARVDLDPEIPRGFQGRTAASEAAAASPRSRPARVDFGASDAPLTPDQSRPARAASRSRGRSRPLRSPTTSSGVRLRPEARPGRSSRTSTSARSRSGTTAAIKAINPGVNLPERDITPIYRSDGSGTTYNFTDYLSHVSKEWKNKVGNGTQPNFPTGVGARGSSGVAAKLTQHDGGITYVDVAYSLKNNFKIAKIRNRAGKFQLPGSRRSRRRRTRSSSVAEQPERASRSSTPNPRSRRPTRSARSPR